MEGKRTSPNLTLVLRLTPMYCITGLGQAQIAGVSLGTKLPQPFFIQSGRSGNELVHTDQLHFLKVVQHLPSVMQTERLR